MSPLREREDMAGVDCIILGFGVQAVIMKRRELDCSSAGVRCYLMIRKSEGRREAGRRVVERDILTRLSILRHAVEERAVNVNVNEVRVAMCLCAVWGQILEWIKQFRGKRPSIPMRFTAYGTTRHTWSTIVVLSEVWRASTMLQATAETQFKVRWNIVIKFGTSPREVGQFVFMTVRARTETVVDGNKCRVVGARALFGTARANARVPRIPFISVDAQAPHRKKRAHARSVDKDDHEYTVPYNPRDMMNTT
ncbi:hypothetical protein B0H12DRAFT_1069940 [Mycena haematopus]|nr:hypothetical protein B0H12DRAFT_1069940 [Mycena haematopus]